MPILNHSLKKSRFTPSKWEKMKVNNLVMAIKQGRIKPKEPKKKYEEDIFDIWDGNDSRLKGMPPAIPPSKIALPSHEESYNPADEYLLEPEEEAEFDALDPEDKEGKIKPQKFPNLRSVPAYGNLIKERFSRCLDLYLAPRLRRKKLDIKQESLLPKLPSPSELKPFPSSLAIIYKGNVGKTMISISSSGEFLVSGDEEGNLIVFEVNSGYPIKKYKFDGVIRDVKFSPNSESEVCIVAFDSFVSVMKFPFINGNFDYSEEPANTYSKISWQIPQIEDEIMRIVFPYEIKSLAFHRKGDYFATTSLSNEEVVVHKISNKSSQKIFGASKGGIHQVAFHPTKPQIFLMSQRNVYLYSLVKSSLVKKLVTGAQVSTAMDVHRSGDHLIVGSANQRVLWFDLDLDDKPFRVLKYHEKGINSVTFHQFYHLFATASTDSRL